jgi:hypothetical protein
MFVLKPRAEPEFAYGPACQLERFSAPVARLLSRGSLPSDFRQPALLGLLPFDLRSFVSHFKRALGKECRLCVYLF